MVRAKLLYVGAPSIDSYRAINKKSKIGTIFWPCKTKYVGFGKSGILRSATRATARIFDKNIENTSKKLRLLTFDFSLFTLKSTCAGPTEIAYAQSSRLEPTGAADIGDVWKQPEEIVISWAERGSPF